MAASASEGSGSGQTSMTGETMTFASTTALRTSDASSGLPRFGDGLRHVGEAVLDHALPAVESRPFGRNGDAAAADFPSQFVTGVEVECIADFLRDRRPALAGDGRGGHGVCLLPRIGQVTKCCAELAYF